MAQEVGQPGDRFRVGDHTLSLEAAHHEPHVAGYPVRRKGSEPLLERCQIIAPIADLSAEHLGPDAGDRFVGTDQFDRLTRQKLGGFFPFEQTIEMPLLPIGCG